MTLECHNAARWYGVAGWSCPSHTPPFPQLDLHGNARSHCSLLLYEFVLKGESRQRTVWVARITLHLGLLPRCGFPAHAVLQLSEILLHSEWNGVWNRRNRLKAQGCDEPCIPRNRSDKEHAEDERQPSSHLSSLPIWLTRRARCI
jgi:hypothetical protein